MFANLFSLMAFSFLTAFALGRPWIEFLKRSKSLQSFRELGPKSHIQNKKNTPTMGAWIFLFPFFVVMVFLYFYNPLPELLILALATLAAAFIGAADDVLKIWQSNYKGIDSRSKLFLQAIISTGIAFYASRNFDLEFLSLEFLLAAFWAFLVIAGSANAINLTDGLDGLATGLMLVTFLGLGIFLYEYCHHGLESSLYLSLSLALLAALAAFWLYNRKPAQVFMGDTGSLALGTCLGTMVYLARAEWYLFVFALLPIIEALSVIIQVASSKLSRKFLAKDLRPFKMAPLHHHFELSGLPETKVVNYFILIQFLIILVFLIYYLEIR